MGAAILSVPELVLDAREAKGLAEAITGVAAFYDIPADPKTLAWVNLAMVGMTVYGTRALAYSNRLKAEARLKLAAATRPAAAPSVKANGVDQAAAAASALASHTGQPPVGE